MEKETLERLKKDQQENLAIIEKNIFIFFLPAIVYCVLGFIIGFNVPLLIGISVGVQFIMLVAFCEGATESMFDPEDWVKNKIEASNKRKRLKFLKRTAKEREQMIYVYEETNKEDEDLTEKIEQSKIGYEVKNTRKPDSKFSKN